MGQALCTARVVLNHDPALLLQQKEGLRNKWAELGRKAPPGYNPRFGTKSVFLARLSA